MGKYLKALLNNLNEKTYFNNLDSIEFYNKESKDKTKLPKDEEDKLKEELDELETKNRYWNLKMFKSNLLKLRSKQARLVGIPILVGGLSIFSFTSNIKNTETVDAYQKVTINYDEENILSEEIDDKIYVNDGSVEFDHDYIDENIENVDFLIGSANIQFGEGEDSYKATFDINEDGTWTYKSGENVTYFNLDKTDSTELKSVDQKYLDILSEAAIILLKNTKDEATKNLIKELLTNNKNDILVELSLYKYVDTIDAEYNRDLYMYRVLLLVFDIVVGTLYFSGLKYLLKVPKLVVDNTKIFETPSSSSSSSRELMSIRNAALKYKAIFYTAEKARINAIKEILDKHTFNDDILSKYEKKLLKEDK